MKLHVFVHDKPVATLASTDGFRHVLAYHPDAAPEQFVSLLMPVRTESYAYPEIHPVFRMNLLSVVGRNAIGRVKVAVPGADPTQPPVPFELAHVLRGDNSEDAFMELVRRHAVSGVSGVVPKFLSASPPGERDKLTLATDQHIIKGSSARLPGVAMNEHLCMEVARQAGIATARTEVSDDGRALVVHRFDFEADGVTRKGMEDLCSLLLLRPEEKYQSTWERVVQRIKDVVPLPEPQNAALSQLADLLLLTYALRNADCHTKNIALLYSSREAISLAPVYDMLTTSVYDDFVKNPPSLPIEGRSTWLPKKSLERFLQTRCAVMPTQTRERTLRLCEAIVQVTPQVIAATRRYPEFYETGKRMLQAWNVGMNSLRLQKTWSLPSLDEPIAQARFSEVAPISPTAREKIGSTPLLGKR